MKQQVNMMDVLVKIDEQLQQRLQQLAEAKACSANSILSEAIHDYVKREEARQNLNDELTAAWQEYEQTGLHLTYDELSDWMDKWGTDEETEIPRCHK